ncbi:YraN family protein [Ornithobacterium rhinotracheale]|uniref:YraN family protein n=1 Tax=Ornithobacterium rhinotracheale TaxID=28251 RepID=UPI0038736632
MAEHNEFGKLAEDYAAEKYRKNGYEILAQNWYFHPAEIDIIAKRDNVLAIVEVKARHSEIFENPEDSVTRAKKKRLIAAADAYIQENDLDVECRFDIAVVTKKGQKLHFKVFTDAFYAHEI